MKQLRLFLFVCIICVSVFFLVKIVISAYSMKDLMAEQTKGSSDKERYIIVIAQEYDNPFWRLLEQGVLKEANQHNLKIDYMGPARLNQLEQQLLLEKAIYLKPDGIIVQGIHNEHYTQLINQAFDYGIPVVTVDADAAQSKRIAYIGTNQLEAGKLLGHYIIGNDSSSKYIGVIVGSLEAENQKERLAGLAAEVELSSSSQIVAIRSSSISRLKAADETVQLLKEHPHINTIVGLSSLDAAGIVDGLNYLNKTGVNVFGFDQLSITKELIEQHKVAVSLAQQPELMGEKAIETLVNYFNGEQFELEQFIPATLISQ